MPTEHAANLPRVTSLLKREVCAKLTEVVLAVVTRSAINSHKVAVSALRTGAVVAVNSMAAPSSPSPRGTAFHTVVVGAARCPTVKSFPKSKAAASRTPSC